MEEGKEGAKGEGKAEEGEGKKFGLTMPPRSDTASGHDQNRSRH